MINVPESTSHRLVIQARAMPESGRGLAYVALGLLFVYIGIQQQRTLLIVLGAINAALSIFSFRPLTDEATATLDRTAGTLVYETKNVSGSQTLTYPLSDVISAEIEERRLLLRTLYRLQLVLANGQKLPLGIAPDRLRTDKAAAADQLKVFLGSTH